MIIIGETRQQQNIMYNVAYDIKTTGHVYVELWTDLPYERWKMIGMWKENGKIEN